MKDVIDQIEQIRRQNNSVWMEILRIAYEEAPDRTKMVIRVIADNDRKINELLEKLASKSS